MNSTEVCNDWDWTIVGASSTGNSHLEDGSGCQDYFGYRRTRDKVAIAVADGAGSAKDSATGARVAVEEALTACLLLGEEHLHPEPEKISHLKVLQAARNALEGQISGSLGDLACTLSVVVITRNRIWGLQVGDGWIVAEKTDGSLSVLAAPVKGEYSNETVFMTSRDYLDEAVFFEQAVGKIKAIFVITDGLESSAINQLTEQPFAPFYKGLVDAVRTSQMTEQDLSGELELFLYSPRISSKSEDDKTLLLVTAKREVESSSVQVIETTKPALQIASAIDSADNPAEGGQREKETARSQKPQTMEPAVLDRSSEAVSGAGIWARFALWWHHNVTGSLPK